MIVHSVVHVAVADVAVAVAVEALARCAGAVTVAGLRLVTRCPPPSGMLPSFSISTCTSLPALSVRARQLRGARALCS